MAEYPHLDELPEVELGLEGSKILGAQHEGGIGRSRNAFNLAYTIRSLQPRATVTMRQSVNMLNVDIAGGRTLDADSGESIEKAIAVLVRGRLRSTRHHVRTVTRPHRTAEDPLDRLQRQATVSPVRVRPRPLPGPRSRRRPQTPDRDRRRPVDMGTIRGRETTRPVRDRRSPLRRRRRGRLPCSNRRLRLERLT